VLYREGEAIDLNTLVTAAGLSLAAASAINNEGIIAWYARTTDGASHGHLLVPVE
jgi:hypothetical protein